MFKSRKELLKEIANRKVYLFGSGGYADKISKEIIDMGVAYLDNNPEKWGKEKNGKPILSPEVLNSREEPVYVIITSSFADSIAIQLEKMGLFQVDDFLDGFLLMSDKNFNNYLNLLKFKDIHKGERVFLVGNGPSLRMEDLEKLKDEHTFASNKIYLAFDEVSWRPEFYVSIDSMFVLNNFKKIQEINCHKFILRDAYDKFDKKDDVIWLGLGGVDEKAGIDEQIFPEDISRGMIVFGGHTVMYAMMQIAYFMGFSEMYTIGLDYSYNSANQKELKDGNNIFLGKDGDVNHFHKDYREEGEIWLPTRLDLQYKSYAYAKKFLDGKGIKVYNASRKTALDVFPRVDFDSLF